MTNDDKQASILVIDDDVTILKLVSKHLEHHGYAVSTVTEGDKALPQAKSLRPNLILLDVMMPDVDGFEVCRRLKADEATHHIPVIFLTALTDMNHKIKGFEVGGVDYITKPVRLAELQARVNTHLALRHLQRQLNLQNQQLQQEISRREQAEIALQAANEALAEKVKLRTVELEAANASLKQEIIERQQAEMALRQSHTRYHNLAANIPGMIYQFLLRPDGSMAFPYISPGSVAICGLTPEEAQENPQDLFDMVHPEDLAHFHETIEQSAETMTPWHWIGRIIIEGQTKWLRGDSRPERQPDHSILWDGLLIDITERKQLEEQLYQAQRLEAVGQLAGGVAHNFNNLLTAIMGYAGLSLESLPPDHSATEDLRGIQRMSQRGAELTRHLLTFTRNQLIQPRVVNLNRAVERLEKMLRQLLTETIELHTHLAPDVGQVKMDVGQFEQVLVNLVLNARDAMPDGGSVTITTELLALDGAGRNQYKELEPGKYVRLVVADTGLGMDRETQARIFEPFFTTKEVDQGTGLGLSICFGVVKQHGGHIAVESEVGQGTQFEILLPQFEVLPPTDGTHEQDKRPSGGTETILLVEDDPSIRTVTARALSKQGYTVLEAKDGTAALRLIERQNISRLHLLLTDVVMPRLGGVPLAERLQAQYPTLKVIFMSGHPDDRTDGQTIPRPEAPFLTKPYTPTTLLRQVRAVLDREDGQ